MATYVGKWDCPACGTKRIPGWKDGRTVERCPACNGPSTGKWYLDNRDMVIANPREVDKAKKRRAWKCGHCGHMNDADDQACDACGNAKDAATGDEQFVQREYQPFQQPTSAEDTEDARRESVNVRLDETGAVVQEDKPQQQGGEIERGYSKSGRQKQAAMDAKLQLLRRRRWIAAGIGVGVLAFIAFLLLWKKEVPVTVVGFAWERTVDIDNFGPVQESAWYSAPPGAYNVSSSREIHHYNTIVVGRDCHTETVQEVCGTIDNGNGTFSDRYCSTTREVCTDRTIEEPVYETRYYYTIDKWHFDHTEQAKAEDKKPFWPVFSKVQSDPGRWRESGRTETYRLHLLLEGGRIEKQTVPFDRWTHTKDRQVLMGYKNVVFGYWMGLKKER